MPSRFAFVCLLCALVITPGLGRADPASQTITIHSDRFVPARLELAPGIKVKLTISNDSGLPAEFESYDLSREIIVPTGQSVTLFVGPLTIGRYEFFNDFNPAVRGSILVKSISSREN